MGNTPSDVSHEEDTLSDVPYEEDTVVEPPTKPRRKYYNLTAFDAPRRLSREMMTFIEGANLGTIRIGDRDVPLRSVLRSPATGMTSFRVLSAIVHQYIRTNNLHANVNPVLPQNIFGADEWMKKTLGSTFTKLRNEQLNIMASNGIKDGDLRNPNRERRYGNEYHAFNPDEFSSISFVGVIGKSITERTDDEPFDHESYSDLVDIALARNAFDSNAPYDAVFAMGATDRVRAAIDHDTIIMKSLNPR